MPPCVGFRDRPNSRFIQRQQPLRPITPAGLDAKLPFVVDMTSTQKKELLMTTQSNVCVCGACAASQCTCGCQHPPPPPIVSPRWGAVCPGGEPPPCRNCQHGNAGI